MRKDADQAIRPPGSPTASSLEPPPTSTTAMVPSAEPSSVRVAPTKARRASSSPVSTLSGMPPASSTAPTRSSRLDALRIAAVATATISSAPTSRAHAACARTTSAVSAIFSAGIEPPSRRLRPMRVNARWVTSSRSPSSPASATSRRVVLLPISMQAQIKGDRAAVCLAATAAPAPGAMRPRTRGTAQ